MTRPPGEQAAGVGPQRGPSDRPESPTGDEVVTLRAQVADLKAQLEAGEPAAADKSGPRTGRWRPWVAGVLVALAALVAPAAILATWAHDEVANTDRYVETVAPLGSDPAVQNALIARISTEIFNRLDVQAVTQDAVDALAAQGLPPRVVQSLSALKVPIANGVRSFVTERVSRIIKSPEFEQAWVAANREAHTQMVAVLTGEGTSTIDVSGNTVSVNLAAVIRTVKTQLTQAGFDLAARIPEVNAQFTILQSADLAKAQTAFDLLKRAARVLPVLGVLLLAGAVYVARDRRRTLLVAALAIAGSMLVLGAGLNVFRSVYLDAVPADQLPQNAAASIYDRLVLFIRLNLRAVLVVFLAVAAGAWLTGPSTTAVATRRGVARALGAVRGGGERVGVTTGPVGVFAYTYRTVLRALVIGAGVVVYVQAAHPTGAWTLKVVAVVAVVLLVVELVSRPPRKADEKEQPASPTTPSPA